MRALAFVTLVIAGCNGAASARYRHSTPPPLPAADAPLDPEAVIVTFAPFTWQSTAGTTENFRLMVSTMGGSDAPTGGQRVGDVRTSNHVLDAGDRAALYCVWGPGQNDDCVGDDVRGRVHVLAAVTALREDAARAGANEVRDVRCFVRSRRRGGALWCEGVAFAGAPAPPVHPQLEPALVARPSAAPSPWKVSATASAGRYGDRMVLGTTVDLGYRAVKVAFHMVSPPDQASAGIGIDLLYRRRVTGRVSALGGVTAMMLSPLARGGEADIAATRGAIGPVLGVGWEAKHASLFDGFGKPFAELRLGWLAARRTHDGDDMAGLGLELLVGLTTP
jgi:hypothetical protein